MLSPSVLLPLTGGGSTVQVRVQLAIQIFFREVLLTCASMGLDRRDGRRVVGVVVRRWQSIRGCRRPLLCPVLIHVGVQALAVRVTE